jgi:hypothetical protein
MVEERWTHGRTKMGCMAWVRAFSKLHGWELGVFEREIMISGVLVWHSEAAF